ncbi:alpha/beta family hydrolase [Streptomyces polyrhachis]|uniref:Alpha/beta family hydrolase n=1 Tax=Streptomyces polyrhachis TaxID=1282885 RepID=A0ABW2GJ61_9ACTN
MKQESVSTPVGEGRISWYPAENARLVLALGHGAGGSGPSRDLLALAGRLPRAGVTVALVDQPWRVAGRKVAPAPRTLDAAWRALWPALAASGAPVVAGGRSAGARVACRTAGELGARGVLALAFPLHPPGRPERSRAGELLGAGADTLVVQGERDAFGRPAEFPPGTRLVPVPWADHSFAVPKSAGIGADGALEVLVDGVAAWLRGL